MASTAAWSPSYCRPPSKLVNTPAERPDAIYIHSSSSPGLPSPYTFLRAPQRVGEQDDQEPQVLGRLQSGFASARGLIGGHGCSDESGETSKKETEVSKGRLVRPKKKPAGRSETIPAGILSGGPLVVDGEDRDISVNSAAECDPQKWEQQIKRSPSVVECDAATVQRPLRSETKRKAPGGRKPKPKKRKDYHGGDSEVALPPKKLSSTQVVVSDESELEGSDGASHIFSGNCHRVTETRKALGVALEIWKSDVVKRQEHRQKLNAAKSKGTKRMITEKTQVIPGRTCASEDSKPRASCSPSIEGSNSTKMVGNISLNDEGIDGMHVEDRAHSMCLSRRRDWTPVQDSIANDAAAQPAPSEEIPNSPTESPAHAFASVLRNFNYSRNKDPPPSAVDEGHCPTRCRRIELLDPAQDAFSGPAGPQVRSVVRLPKAKTKVVNLKKVPKKGKTITSLATAAYQPHEEDYAVGAVQKDTTTISKQQIEDASKRQANRSGKGRKLGRAQKQPRSKRKNSMGPTTTNNVTASVRSRGRIIVPEIQRKLCPPETANVQLQEQVFLFGTSSQLAVEDSPAVIRDTVQAINESETSPAKSTITDHTNDSPNVTGRGGVLGSKSKLRVPTAPHGTNLSCGQADRELWSVAARDGTSGLLTVQHQNGLAQRHMREATVGTIFDLATLESSPSPSKEADVQDIFKPTKLQDDEVNTMDSSLGIALGPHMELPNNVNQEERSSVHDDTALSRGLWLPNQRLQEHPVQLGDGDSSEQQREPSGITASFSICQDMSGEIASDLRPLKTSSSPVGKFSQRARKTAVAPYRTALQPLDANVTLAYMSKVNTQSNSRSRALSTVAKLTTEHTSHYAAHECGQDPQALSHTCEPVAALPGKRKRGRPRKEPQTTELAGSRTPLGSKETATKKPSASHLTLTSTPNDYVDIDEIFDSDPQITPSPPRRKANSNSILKEPLQLSADRDFDSGGTNINPEANAAGRNVESNDAQSSDRLQTLFRQITAAIKSEAASHGTSHSCWHEKILMFDPIVIEDLTVWLNEQGVRYEAVRAKPKEKTKPRRMKAKTSEQASQPVTGGIDLGTHEDGRCYEELKPWVVQKWCEEMSVCCFSRDAIKGGWGSRHKSS